MQLTLDNTEPVTSCHSAQPKRRKRPLPLLPLHAEEPLHFSAHDGCQNVDSHLPEALASKAGQLVTLE